PSSLQRVLDNIDDWIIRDAHSITNQAAVMPSMLSQDEQNALSDRLKASPQRYVAQANITPSVTPVWRHDHFESWPVALRLFALQADSGVEVLPGGLARVSPNRQMLGRSPTSGLLTQDCLIVSDHSIDHDSSLLPGDGETIRLRRSGAELSSRVAEHFYWLGRNVERCESIARLLRTTLVRLAGENDLADLPEMPRLIAGLASVGQLEPDYVIEGLDGAMPQLEKSLPASVLDATRPNGLAASAGFAIMNAKAVRERMSLDAYRIFQHLEELIVRKPDMTDQFGHGHLPRSSSTDSVSGAIECLNDTLTQLLAFGGLTNESMTRTHGWRFVLLGRRIERAFQTAELLLATLVRPTEQERAVCAAILDATDCLLTYRSRYRSLVQTAPTIDLLVTDESNPRSLQYQLDRIETLLRQLPTDPNQIGLGRDEQLAAMLALDLRIADVNELVAVYPGGARNQFENLLRSIQTGLPDLSRAIDGRYLIHTSSRQLVTGDREAVHRLPMMAKQNDDASNVASSDAAEEAT
ncbi:MAG: circularly permuted type 2 ATP-grasp protein, partial [Planctomycetota bacterium]